RRAGRGMLARSGCVLDMTGCDVVFAIARAEEGSFHESNAARISRDPVLRVPEHVIGLRAGIGMSRPLVGLRGLEEPDARAGPGRMADFEDGCRRSPRSEGNRARRSFAFLKSRTQADAAQSSE